jgi:integrase
VAKVSFLLTQPKAEKPTPIFAFIAFDGQRVKVYSGLSIHPKQWIKAEQRAQERGYPANGAVNDTLKLLAERLLKCYDTYRAKGELPTVEALREVAVPTPAPVVISAEPIAAQFWNIFAEWVALAHARGKVTSGRLYTTVGRHLRNFEQASGMAADFDTITASFGDRYTTYLLHNARLTDNTVAKQVSTLKRFLRWARERGHTTATAFERLNWKRHEADIMTLTSEEVTALEQLVLPIGTYLDNARALFLLACYTGLRFSDLVSIQPEHVRGTMLRLTTKKTREIVSVPLQSPALAIVNRLLAGEVHPITNQRLNDYLKELGQLACIDSPVEVIRFRGGHRESATFAKWERLGCHTGRRTFVTLSLERGLRPELVMKITGHRSWRSFQRYVNITEQTVEREFARVYEMPVRTT